MAKRSMALPGWLLVLLVTASPVTGCVAAAAAAGAGAGIYLTTRGAESLVQGSISDVEARARAVMNDMSITLVGSSTDEQAATRELRGKAGELDVTVEMEQRNPTTTRVEVTARRNVAEWDQGFARQVLSRIVQQG